MKSDFYIITLDILTVVSLFAGIMMFFFPTEQKKKFVTYKRSRYIAGIVFFLYGILCFVHSNFQLRSVNVQHAIAFSLSIYYLSGILFSYSLISLLSKEYFNRRRIILDSIRYFIFLLFIAASLVLDPPYSKIALTLSATYFFVDILRIITLFKKNYRKCVKGINNYYSEYNIQNYVDWMYKASVLIMAYGLSYSVVAYTSSLFIGIFSFFGIFLMTYIVVAFNNYLMFVEKIDLSQEDSYKECSENTAIITESLSYAGIEKELQRWVKQKKFLSEGITIATLSAELKTNRTYLSCYINNTYSCSFRDFVSKLRIVEAKRMLKEETSKDIHEIASITGFSSTSNFHRTFKKHEAKTPTAYKEEIML